MGDDVSRGSPRAASRRRDARETEPGGRVDRSRSRSELGQAVVTDPGIMAVARFAGLVDCRPQNLIARAFRALLGVMPSASGPRRCDCKKPLARGRRDLRIFSAKTGAYSPNARRRRRRDA